MTTRWPIHDTLIVVPMKDPGQSKTRLSGALDARERRALARALYRRTLEFLAEAQAQARFDIAVITASAVAARLARKAGVRVIDERPDGTLSDAVQQAADWADRFHYRRLCVIPADLAAPRVEDLVRLLSSDAPVTVCPSTDLGTNALLTEPPTAIPFCYGRRSAARHLDAARDQGVNAVLLPLESLKFDIDTAECLTRALREVPDMQGLR